MDGALKLMAGFPVSRDVGGVLLARLRGSNRQTAADDA